MRKDEYGIMDPTRIPEHIAIIMDGNGRWARKRLCPRSYGHRAGMEALRRIIEACVELKINVLTVYAFSTENWRRPRDEITSLMNLLLEYINRELQALHEKGVRIRILGVIDQFGSRIQEELERAMQLTASNTTLILNVALNYGGRMELVRAVKHIAEMAKNGLLEPADITEEVLASQLFTAGIPDPDLLIRTAGEMRLSNFLLWQIAYTELWITDILWPDFTKDDLVRAIIDYQQRDRRFGAINRETGW